jgi:hypothetical protein
VGDTVMAVVGIVGEAAATVGAAVGIVGADVARVGVSVGAAVSGAVGIGVGGSWHAFLENTSVTKPSRQSHTYPSHT